jgi:hypothetical protein
MLRRRFQSYIFEALPANAALISLGVCVNSKLRALANKPPLLHRLTHKALGPRGSSATCAALSDSDNVGDAGILCSADDVASAQAVEKAIASAPSRREALLQMDSKKRIIAEKFRGFVELQSLDAVLSEWSPSAFRNAAAATCVGLEKLKAALALGNVTDDNVPPQNEAVNLDDDQSLLRETFVYRAAPFAVTASTPTDALLKFVAHSQVVVKMDVEGFEHNIVKGADAFLKLTSMRPKVIVAEVWKHLDIGAFCARMVRYGYTAYSPDGSKTPHWLRFSEDCRRFHESMKIVFGTLVFVLPGFEHVVNGAPRL